MLDTWVATNTEGTRAWRLEHESDYNKGDKLYKVEFIRTGLARVTEVANDD